MVENANVKDRFLSAMEGEYIGMCFHPPEYPECWVYSFTSNWYKIEHHPADILDLLTWQ